MRKMLFLAILLIGSLSAYAQERRLELSLYGGTQSYKKINNPYDGSFSSGLGGGFQARYGLSNRTYWVTDLFVGTDDGTEIRREVAPRVERLFGLYRRDYVISTGIGVNLIATERFRGYVQLLGGMGTVQGYTSRYLSEAKGVVREPLRRTSYLIASGVGLNVWLSRHWGIGFGYTLRYLGDVDASQSFALGVSYAL